MCGWVRLQRAVSFSPTARLGNLQYRPRSHEGVGAQVVQVEKGSRIQIKSPRNAEWKFTLAQVYSSGRVSVGTMIVGARVAVGLKKSSVGCSASKGYPGSTVPVTGGTPPVSPPDGLVTMTMGVVLRSSSESSGAFEAGILQPDSNRAEKTILIIRIKIFFFIETSLSQVNRV